MRSDNSNPFAVIIAAAGSSSRFTVRSPKGTYSPRNKKPFVSIRGKPLWQHSVEKFVARPEVEQIIIVLSPKDTEWFQNEFSEEINRFSLDIVEGGKERTVSISNGFYAVKPKIKYIAVHDAARPCVSDEAIEAVFNTAIQTGAAILASPLTGTIKRMENSVITETVPRTGLWEAQTPQVFCRNILAKAFAQRGTREPTDEAQLLEYTGYSVSIVPSSRLNLKITIPDDLLLAEKILEM